MRPRKTSPVEGHKVERIPTFIQDDFILAIKNLKQFCSIIDKQESESSKTLMKNYVIIRLVSIVEFNLKAQISELIDELDLRPEDIITDDSISIKPDVLQNLKSDYYTKGRIIIALLDKMNPGLIYAIMSRINHLDYFNWYDSLQPLHNGKTYSRFKALYKLRNDIAHNLVDVEDSIPILTKKINDFRDFVYFITIFTTMNIGINVKKWTELEIEKKWTPLKKLPIPTLHKYRQITKKLRSDYKPYN